jgi:hypothetical protein
MASAKFRRKAADPNRKWYFAIVEKLLLYNISVSETSQQDILNVTVYYIY